MIQELLMCTSMFGITAGDYDCIGTAPKFLVLPRLGDVSTSFPPLLL